MPTAKELRLWAATARRWAVELNDNRAAQCAATLAAELNDLAARMEVSDRQLV